MSTTRGRSSKEIFWMGRQGQGMFLLSCAKHWHRNGNELGVNRDAAVGVVEACLEDYRKGLVNPGSWLALADLLDEVTDCQTDLLRHTIAVCFGPSPF